MLTRDRSNLLLEARRFDSGGGGGSSNKSGKILGIIIIVRLRHLSHWKSVANSITCHRAVHRPCVFVVPDMQQVVEQTVGAGEGELTGRETGGGASTDWNGG